MKKNMLAIEMTGIVDENHHLLLDEMLPITGPKRVRVLVMYQSDEIDEVEWLQFAARNPAFDFLKDAGEDIYTIDDGEPFQDEI